MSPRLARSRGPILAAAVAIAAAIVVIFILSTSGDPERPGGTLPTSSPGATTPTAPLPSPSPTGSTAAAGSVTVALAGDIACDPGRSAFNGGEGRPSECRMKATSDLVLGMDVDAVITLGDNQYEDGAYEKYQRSYDPTWGRFKDKTYPAPGNHDYRSAAGYYRYFGDRAGDPSKGYYSFALGSWHVVVLNSNCGQAGGCGRESPQVAWLRRDLGANQNRCTMAVWHHARFSSGRHGSSDATADFWDALYDHGADLVVTGHDHTYERFAPQTPDGRRDGVRGIRSFVAGTGGRNLYRFEKIERNSEARNNTSFGVLKLTLASESYDWAFTPAPPATFTDTGSGACH